MSEATQKGRGRPRDPQLETRMYIAVAACTPGRDGAGTSIEWVAREAKVGKSSNYRRWPDAGALLVDALAAQIQLPVEIDTVLSELTSSYWPARCPPCSSVIRANRSCGCRRKWRRFRRYGRDGALSPMHFSRRRDRSCAAASTASCEPLPMSACYSTWSSEACCCTISPRPTGGHPRYTATRTTRRCASPLRSAPQQQISPDNSLRYAGCPYNVGHIPWDVACNAHHCPTLNGGSRH